MSTGHQDCGGLFKSFTFQDIRGANPPKEKGVYVLRIAERGTPVSEILEQTSQAIKHLQWPVVMDKMRTKVSRLSAIGDCPVIYIGSAGTGNESKNTLKGRHEEFSDRHTAMYPVWALLYFGWELEYGWKMEPRPGELEAALKRQYRQHHDSLPALTAR